MTKHYQTTLFADLDPDVELEPYVVLIDDPRWQGCLDELASARWICLDTEFHGPSGPWKRKEIDYWKSSIRLVQVGLPSGLVLIFSLGGLLEDRVACIKRHAAALEVLRGVIESATVPKCGMALLTEYLLLRIHFGWKPRCLRDVGLMSQVYWAGVGSKPARWTETGLVHQAILKHNLASICERLGIAVDKTEQTSDWAGDLMNKQYNYAARDVIVPRQAWVELHRRARNEDVLSSMQIECDAQPAFCESEYNGLPIDLNQARADYAIWEKVRETFLKPFHDLFPGVNPSSPAQVAKALTDALDTSKCNRCGATYDPLTTTPVGTPLPKDFSCCIEGKMERTGKRSFFELKQIRGKLQRQPSTSDEALVPYKDIWYINALLEGRSTGACMNWLKAAIVNAFDSGTGMRIRADFRQIAGGYAEHGSVDGEPGRGMGRSSASRPINTQNPSNLQPAHEKAGAVSVRRCIKPATGRAFIVADLSQSHARIAAEWSQDPIMLRDYNAGNDFHLAMTHRVMAQQPEFKTLTFEQVVTAFKDPADPLHKRVKSQRGGGVKSTNYAKLNLSGVQTLKTQMETAAVPTMMSEDEVGLMIASWNDLYQVLYQKQRRHIKRTNATRHWFGEIGVEGEYGEVRGLTNRRLFLIKEYKPPRERYDGTMSEGYWSVKATDAVSSIWMMSEADIIKRVGGLLVPIFDAHPEWDACFCNMAHDEWDFDCAWDHRIAVATAVQHMMHKSMAMVVKSIPVDEPGARPESLIKASWAAK